MDLTRKLFNRINKNNAVYFIAVFSVRLELAQDPKADHVCLSVVL